MEINLGVSRSLVLCLSVYLSFSQGKLQTDSIWIGIRLEPVMVSCESNSRWIQLYIFKTP